MTQWQHLQKLYLNLQFFEPREDLFKEIGTLIKLKKLYLQGIFELSRLHDLFEIYPWVQRSELSQDNTEQICCLPQLEKLILHNINLPQSFTYQLAHTHKLKKLQLINVDLLSEQQIEIKEDAMSFIVDVNPNTRRIESADETTRITDPEENLDDLLNTIHLLPQLHTLDLSCNRLRYLPTTIVFCDRLKQLILHENELESLPPELASLANLEELNIAIHPESVKTSPDLSFNPEQLADLPCLCRLYILAVRPETNDLPLLQQLVCIRQQLADKAKLQEIGKQLHELQSQPQLCRAHSRKVRLITMILHLLNPTITRSLLARGQQTIEELSQRQEHPLIILQKTLAQAFELQETKTTHRPHKRQRISKN